MCNVPPADVKLEKYWTQFTGLLYLWSCMDKTFHYTMSIDTSSQNIDNVQEPK